VCLWSESIFSIVDGLMGCFNISMAGIAAFLKISILGTWAVFLLSFLSPAAQPPQRDPACSPVSIPYEEVKPIAMALEEAAPAELRRNEPDDPAKAWPVWAARHSAVAQERMTRGDEDLLGNIIIFGTSFTAQPRIIQKDLASTDPAAAKSSQSAGSDNGSLPRKVFDTRVDDFIRALEAPGMNDRLVYLRRLLERKGHSLSSTAGHAKLRQYLIANLLRMLREQQGYEKALEEARRSGNPGTMFAASETLYRARGLSIDTAIFPNYAVEEALKAMRTRGLLKAVQHAAVIGPGLDFADKQGGYDFYPEQTIQPFALIDSLVRIGLSQAGKLDVTAIDISPHVISHLAAARQRAKRGTPYVVQLPRDLSSSWKPGTIAYWEQFGGRIGSPSKSSSLPPVISRLGMRAVSIRPEVVLSVTPCETNIVLQRLNLPDAQKFDLIVATNILVYYDIFEQSLAMANIARMLKPGGFLLSNTALTEFPGSPLNTVDYLKVDYWNDRPDVREHIVWYRRISDANSPGSAR
jgi:SAM-dependent methyltransferase